MDGFGFLIKNLLRKFMERIPEGKPVIKILSGDYTFEVK